MISRKRVGFVAAFVIFTPSPSPEARSNPSSEASEEPTPTPAEETPTPTAEEADGEEETPPPDADAPPPAAEPTAEERVVQTITDYYSVVDTDRDAAWSRMTADYARFVHLIDDAGNIVAQVDGNPVSNSYPTSQWIPGEVVADTVTFALADLPEGEYRLATGFYRPGEGGLRLEAVAPEGSLPDGRALLPEVIVIPAP